MEKPAVEEPTEEKMEVKEEVVEVKEEVVEVKVEVTEVKVEPEAETAGPAEPKSDRHLTEVPGTVGDILYSLHEFRDDEFSAIDLF